MRPDARPLPRLWGANPVALGLAAALAVAAPVLVAVGAPVPVRAPVVAAFLLAGPGLTVAPFLGLGRLGTWAVVPGISLATLALVSLAIVYAGAFSPILGVGVLGVLTLAGAVVGFVRLRRGPAAEGDLVAGGERR